MQIATKIWDSGWGAVFLTVYTGVAIQLVRPEPLFLKTLSVLPTILVMFLADQQNNRLINFFAGGELRRSTDQIQKITGHDDFYESASEELQNRVDDFDRRAYQKNISILAGLIIALTTPFVGFYLRGTLGLGIGLVIGLLATQLLTRRSIQELNRLAQNISEPYTAKYENQ
ncbi:hypothetical protein ACNO8S_20090 (plasmid) [Haloarcula sp. KBTZ06]|uniref:hypothetical protein n=1 Tax=unclassified Haloarcula TaxID=2624677 RepID=UPI00059556C0|nr:MULTISPECIES: hypothetical protein [unclassified Haloarcula]AJF24454.1 hypothetical protein SG26_01340 [Haloarcula sp. CBA1115]KAA9401055.1 hypothetical protein Har1131_20825 [Haloarcula sp. CBA1131]KZX49059.1 hypothetical protein AV929_20925 [Haloarcula sp. K1]